MDEDLFISPSMAVSAMVMRHRAKELSARMALIGALRHGIIAWRCSSWRETFTAENGAIYDEAGGHTEEEPKWGWPSYFWYPGLAADNRAWEESNFISFGEITMRSAPKSAICLWLDVNGGGTAKRESNARGVLVRWHDVTQYLLEEPAWREWKLRSPEVPEKLPVSGHYKTALIRMIQRALNDPDAVRQDPRGCLLDAFDDNEPPDSALRDLVREIREAIKPVNSAPCD